MLLLHMLTAGESALPPVRNMMPFSIVHLLTS